MKHSLALTALAASALALTACAGSADPNYMPVTEELDIYKVHLVEADKEGFRAALDITCNLEVPPSGGKNSSVTLTTLNQVWQLLNPQQRYKCDATVNQAKTDGDRGVVTIVGPEISAAEDSSHKASDAVSDSYTRALMDLYSKCATYNMGFLENDVLNSDEARDVEAAATLCPDHPEINTVKAMSAPQAGQIEAEDNRIQELIEKREAAAREAEEEARVQEEAEEKAAEEARKKEEEEQRKAEENMIAPGSYLVGDDVKPGTYKSTHPGFENCYWEVSDKNGNIINNNWVIEGTSMIAVIPKSAYIFETHGCGTFYKQ